MSNLVPPTEHRKRLPVPTARPIRYSGNVVALPIEAKPSPFDRLTARLVLERHRAGTLPEGVLVALLAGAGVHQ